MHGTPNIPNPYCNSSPPHLAQIGPSRFNLLYYRISTLPLFPSRSQFSIPDYRLQQANNPVPPSRQGVQVVTRVQSPESRVQGPDPTSI